MRATTRRLVGQSLLHLSVVFGNAFHPLKDMAQLAAEDEDQELGRLATEAAMIVLGAHLDALMLLKPYTAAIICVQCSEREEANFRNVFGAWMTEGDKNRLSFMNFQLSQIAEEHGDKPCPYHQAGGMPTTFEIEFIDDDEDDEDE